MIISVQTLATFIEQNSATYSTLQFARVKQHIIAAGGEVRGRLVNYYLIPAITRDVNGNITAPLYAGNPIQDPSVTILGTIVQFLAAASVLSPARGLQPSSDVDSATKYRSAARSLIDRLNNADAFISDLPSLPLYGITASNALIGEINANKSILTGAIGQPKVGLFGALRLPGGTIPTDLGS